MNVQFLHGTQSERPLVQSYAVCTTVLPCMLDGQLF